MSVSDVTNLRGKDGQTEPLVGPLWPDEGARFPVRECLLIVLNEEWWHRRYAERDLTQLFASLEAVT